MTQTRLGSFIEQVFSTAIGFVTAVISQQIIFPLFDIHVPVYESMQIAAYFTVISVLRGYLVRRYFNKKLHEAAMKLAAKVEHEEMKPEDEQCPVCGFYCLGKGGRECIDKPSLNK